jgi:PadR family transcriptional regulator, regulatory protein PadR
VSDDERSWPAEWLRGALEVCVLRVIGRGPTYGYAIAAALADAGLGTVKGGTLYPLLSRLESGGLVDIEWQAGDGGPGRKYYTLNSAGFAELRRQADAWAAFTSITNGLVHGDPAASTEGART